MLSLKFMGGLLGVVAMAVVIIFADPFGPPGSADDMVYVPAGKAILGGSKHSQMPGPKAHYVQDYWIDRYEVSNENYAKFTSDTGYEQPLFYDDSDFNQPGQPVTGITRFDAERYCAWAGKRLPTEHEWEKAARGVDGQLYPWGNEADLNRAYLNADAPMNVTAMDQDVSPYGVMGMAGNVSEWVDEMFVGGASCENPGTAIQISAEAKAFLGEDKLKFKAYIRGNNIQGLPHMTELAHHLWDDPNTYAEFVGFRCARDPLSQEAAVYTNRSRL